MSKSIRSLVPSIAFFLMTASADAADSKSLNVFAIPSQPIVDEVDTVSKVIGDYGMETFHAKGFPVHATLYLTNYPADAVEKIKQSVEQLADKWHRFPADVAGIDVTAGNWVFLEVTWNATLQRLADEATLALEPLRDHHITVPGWVKNYPEKLPAFQRYGSPNVFSQFQPHLTLLAAEKNPKLKEFESAIKDKKFQANGEIVGIGIGVTNEWGQIAELIAEYHFPSE